MGKIYLSNEKTEHDIINKEDLLQLIESRFSGRDYHQHLLDVLQKSRVSYHDELLRTAQMLLDKDWMLAGLFFENLPTAAENTNPEGIRKWAGTGLKIFDLDKDLAIDYFSYSAPLLKDLNINELEEWALKGITVFEANPPQGRLYFSLKSEDSKEFAETLKGSVALSEIINVLRYYALGLSGVNFNIRSRKTLKTEDDPDSINPVISGNTIYLAPRIRRYGDFEDNYKIYKLSIMHEVGHIRFSSNELKRDGAAELMADIKRRYSTMKKRLPLPGMQANGSIGIADVIALFPNQALAGTILGILEDARVEYRIMERYSGVRTDFERIRHQMLLTRPIPENKVERFIESLLWISIGYEPDYNLDNGTKLLLDQIKPMLLESIFREDSAVIDSLKTAFNIYKLLDEHEGPLSQKEYELLKNLDYRGVSIGACDSKDSLSTRSHENIIKNFIPECKVELTEENEPLQDETSKRQPTYAEKKNWNILGSYRYDEWDSVINDYKSDWCMVNEVEPFGMSSDYYHEASEQYKNEIALIKQVFTRMKPETFRRMKEQTDGTEIDIDAFIDSLIQKKCGVNPDDGLYTRWDKHERDVATLFLVVKGYTGWNIGLIFGGLCLLIAGHILSIPLAIAMGGTFFGASLGSLFGRMANKDIIENFGILSHPNKITSDESVIRDFRKKWHMYYVNKIDGKYLWRHAPCDFSKVSIPGYLNTNEKNTTHLGKEYSFNVEAGIRGNKLITIHSIKGKENLVRIFPSINDEAISGFYCGFVCLTTIDSTRLIGPTILAEDSSRFGEETVIDDPAKMKELDNFWYSEIKKLNFELIPMPSNLVNIPILDPKEQN